MLADAQCHHASRIDRFSLLELLLPNCEPDRVALLYPMREGELSPGWVMSRADAERAIDAYRRGTLADESFESKNKGGKPYRIHGAVRLGLVPHREGRVQVFCVDLDDHTGDGGTVPLADSVARFLAAEPIVFTSKGGKGLHCFFRLAQPMDADAFVAWSKAWGFNRHGEPEVFPKTVKNTQAWLPNEPNEHGGDAYVSGSCESCVVKSLPEAPTTRLTTTTLNFLRGFVRAPGRNEALNKAAFALASKGVTRDEAWRLCSLGARLCGLLHEEPEPTRTTFGSGFDAGASVGTQSEPLNTDDHSDDLLIPLGQHDPATGRLVLSPRRTLPTAEAYVREFNQHAGGCTLHGYAGLLMEWRDNRYCQVEEEWLKQRLQPWLHRALRYVVNKSTGELELVDFESNPTTVKQALDTIRAFVHLPASTVSPSWLGGGKDRPPALELLPCKSLNLHIPTGRVLAPTPALFTINALDFDYDPDPEPPERWIKFLEQLFGDDLESVSLLQEWMGYCLTGDTSQQKMLLLVGPRRSGKGTIGRIITRLVGAGNVVGPTTSSLAGNFGLQPLIEKSLAIVSDARFGGDNVGTVVERLLCISGEDTLTVDRKFLGSVSMKLPTRFMFLTNELPRLNDASTALAGRFLVLRLSTSFYGHEDVTLTDQLLAELPGILQWAIDGWKRLRARGRFVQPKSGEDAIRDLEDLASPVGAFIRDCCVVGVGHRAWIDDLYQAWKGWCEQDGRNAVSTKQAFGRDLMAAAPGVARRRGTGQQAFYEGIGLAGGAR
ncbi:MAG: hypothetical protein KF757_14030 [Phycisphaeraceae bacterium]|nr:hypothetical protein [Phycisphaeraceae bacterium]MCW5763633.1 hypothetical protein [Phycisphaeraceae bacterium]